MLYSALKLGALEAEGGRRHPSFCLEFHSIQRGQELLWRWSRRRDGDAGSARLPSSLGMPS